MRLSILVCHLPKRADLFNRLKTNLDSQIHFDQEDYGLGWGRSWVESGEVDLIWDSRENISIGEKRNALIEKAVKYQKDDTGYLCFVDDDDNVARNYLDLLLRGIATGPDCCSLRGVITDDGQNPRVFEHSIKYKEYATVDPKTHNGVTFERYPNHLNITKTAIAKQFKFPTINHGEDTDWATQIFKSGLLKKEYWIEQTIYKYEHISKK
jgi:hypothetical protein